MNIKSILIGLIAVTLMVACEDPGKSNGSTVDFQAAQQALNANSAVWKSSNISSYQYIYTPHCFCALAGDIVVIVVDGKVSQAFRTPSGTYLTTQELASVYPLEELFKWVQQAIDRKAYSFSVTYNARYGYAESIAYDYDKNAMDDEASYTVRGFQ